MPFGKTYEKVVITAANLRILEAGIEGDAPLVINKFSEKAKEEIMEKQTAGSTAGSKKKRVAKDFEALYKAARYESSEGWFGIPASAFRNSMISACKLVNFFTTRAKVSLFIIPDGYDKNDKTPLVRITKGEPHRFDAPVRLATDVADIRSRPMWNPGWEATVRIRYDADQLTSTDVYNLLYRAGVQIGICEGRNDSKQSNGQGWGSFTLNTEPPKDNEATPEEATLKPNLVSRKRRSKAAPKEPNSTLVSQNSGHGIQE